MSSTNREQTSKDHGLYDIIKFFGTDSKFIRLRGRTYGNGDYQEAKKPVDKWQEAPPLDNRGIVSHIQSGGWLGFVIPQGYILVDIDEVVVGQAIYDGLLNNNIKNIAIKTPNGWQFFFQDTGAVRTQGAKMMTAGGFVVDYRLAGRGYIVMPLPSIEDREVVHIGNLVDPMPAIFIPATTTGKDNSCLTIPIQEGQRNDELFRHACRLTAWTTKYGLDVDVLKVLELVNVFFCIPALPAAEVISIYESSQRYSYDDIEHVKPQSMSIAPENESSQSKIIVAGPDAYNKWIAEYRDNYTCPPKSITTDIRIIDLKLDGGFRPEQLITIGGLPASGKTAMALQIGSNLAQQGHVVLIYNFEMSHAALLQRVISQHNGIEMSNLSNRGIDPDLIEMPLHLTHVGFGVADSAIMIDRIHQDVDHMVSRVATPGTKEHITPIIVLDYLQRLPHLRGKRMNDVRTQINENIAMLKELAVRSKGVVINICALNRESAKTGLDMTSFRETSEIEYASDVLIGLGTTIRQPDGSYKLATKDTLQEARLESSIVVQLKFLKVKHFMEGECFLTFNRNLQRFEPFRTEA